MRRSGVIEADWLAIARGATKAVREAIRSVEDRAATVGSRGAGGDVTLEIDRRAEDAVLTELERSGLPLTVISEEAGEVSLGGGGGEVVVVDPVDGSADVKRGLPLGCVSIAVADGPAMGDVAFAYVALLDRESEWRAERGAGAWRDGESLRVRDDGELELVALEPAKPALVARAAAALDRLGARRIRSLGSLAHSLCLVADGRFDATIGLTRVRSVDVAAAQLIVREAGGTVTFADAGDLSAGLDLEMRSRIVAASRKEHADALLERVIPEQ